MWIVNGEQVINRTREFTDGNGERQRGEILVRWSKEALAEIGVKPFREVSFDQEAYKSTGFSDEEVDGEIVRTHTTEARYTVEEAKAKRIEELNLQVHQLLSKTDFYVIRASDPTSTTAMPQTINDERTQIRTDIVTNEDAINALSVYDDIMGYAISFTDLEG